MPWGNLREEIVLDWKYLLHTETAIKQNKQTKSEANWIRIIFRQGRGSTKPKPGVWWALERDNISVSQLLLLVRKKGGYIDFSPFPKSLMWRLQAPHFETSLQQTCCANHLGSSANTTSLANNRHNAGYRTERKRPGRKPNGDTLMARPGHLTEDQAVVVLGRDAPLATFWHCPDAPHEKKKGGSWWNFDPKGSVSRHIP